MATRVKLEINLVEANFHLSTSALVNTGFEVDTPQLVIPIKLAEQLGIYPNLPSGTKVEEYEAVGGAKVITNYISRCLEVKVKEGDKESPKIIADAVIMEEREVLISDALAAELKLVIQQPKKGIWRFEDDPPEKERQSYPPQYW